MGVLCKSKGRYLLYMGRGGKIWRLPKGHFETKDTYNVVPYKDLKVRIIEKHCKQRVIQTNIRWEKGQV